MLHVIQIAPGSVIAHLKGPLLVSKRKQEPPLHQPFDPPLPQPFDPPVNFNPQVMASQEARTKFITVIANAI